jgi:hypothetical protein
MRRIRSCATTDCALGSVSPAIGAGAANQLTARSARTTAGVDDDE